MFRHQGKTRKYQHNLKIAILLSGVAGMVNVIGFFSVARLTTNVTGHFAFFAAEIYQLQFHIGLNYLSYILAFLLGSFFSSLLVEYYMKRNERSVYVYPILLECILLLVVTFIFSKQLKNLEHIIALLLLFAMGLQNALVTKISNAVVRTTHLTGLFTDLGIELSQLFFYTDASAKTKLLASIKLRLSIITSFFISGIIAGYAFTHIGIISLFIPAGLLIVGLYYDYFRFKILSRKNFS